MNNFDSSFYKRKKVFITGHTGFKGAWLCRILTLAGADVTGYALKPPTNPNLFEIAGIGKDINSVIGDIRDFHKLRRAFDEAKPEIVIHMAAQPIVKEGYERPLYTYETNVMGTANILECVRLSDSVKSFLNVTTDKVYLNRDLDEAFVEDEPLDGYDPYSNSKSCSELVTHSYRSSYFSDGRVAVSTARAGNVIGGGDFARDRIIPDCVRAAMEGKPVIIRNPNSTRPYQHVLEPLFAYLMIGKAQYGDITKSGSYNVGPDESDCVTTGVLADMFCNAWGNGQRWENKAEKNAPHEAKYLKLNCDKLRQTFAWNPHWNLEKAVEKVVEWSKAWLENEDLRSVTDRQIKEYIGQIDELEK